MTKPAFAKIPIEAFGDNRLGSRDLRVLGVLFAHADAEGVCWPSRACLAELTRIDQRHVKRALVRLQEFGWLVVIPGAGRGRLTQYCLTVSISETGADSAPFYGEEKGADSAPLSDEKGGRFGQKRGPIRAEKGADLGHVEHTKESNNYTPLPPPLTDMDENAAPLDPLPPSLALSSSKRGGGVEEGRKELVFPAGLTTREQEQAAHLVTQCDGQAQALLDELAGLMKANAIRVSPLSCLRGMVRRALAGTFEPEAGLRVAEARAKQAQAQAALTRALQPPPEATPAMTPEEAKRQWRDYCERHGIGREAVTT